MSLEKALREMVRAELALQLGPVRRALGQMEEGLGSLQVLRAISGRMEPLVSQLGVMGLRGGVTPAARQEAPARGRPVREARGPKAAEGERACAVKGCRRPARSKGYCSAHYQKLRLLIKTDRRPADWKDDAPPQSAQEVKLPRGRAAQGRVEAPPPAPAEPPKPKAWLRKKGKPGMVSLN